MTSADRQQRIAVSFAKRYYTALVEEPRSLPAFYGSIATVTHFNRRAKGISEVTELLRSLHTSGSVSAVRIEELTITRTTMGNTVVSIKGVLTTKADATQAFSQEVELRELSPNTFAIAADTLSHIHAAAGGRNAIHWATETPPMFAMPSAKAGADMEDIQQPATTTDVAAAAVAAEKKVEEPPAPALAAPPAEAAPQSKASEPALAAGDVAPAVDLSKLSFAERLRLKESTSKGAAPAAPIRVTDKVAKREDAAAATEEKPKRKFGEEAKAKSGEQKPREPRRAAKEGAAEGEKRRPEADKKPRNGGRAIVFYDIIIKGLPENSTEQDVRHIVGGTATVKQVKVESRAGKRDPQETRTFAFVQLDHEVLKAAEVSRSDAVAGIIADAQKRKVVTEKMQMEEVHERKYVA